MGSLYNGKQGCYSEVPKKGKGGLTEMSWSTQMQVQSPIDEMRNPICRSGICFFLPSFFPAEKKHKCPCEKQVKGES